MYNLLSCTPYCSYYLLLVVVVVESEEIVLDSSLNSDLQFINQQLHPCHNLSLIKMPSCQQSSKYVQFLKISHFIL